MRVGSSRGRQSYLSNFIGFPTRVIILVILFIGILFPFYWMITNAFKLEQVVINLLENAIRYTETGGILLRAWRDQGELVIRVQDTGIGIPKALQARIFERFFVVDKSRSKQKGGTGLGLAIVKQIVDMYKGSIKLTSERGKGSSFCVRFPLHGRARDTVVSAKDETYFSSSL